MRSTKRHLNSLLALIVIIAVSLLGGCNDGSATGPVPAGNADILVVLFDFEDEQVPDEVVLVNAHATLDGRDATSGGGALVGRRTHHLDP